MKITMPFVLKLRSSLTLNSMRHALLACCALAVVSPSVCCAQAPAVAEAAAPSDQPKPDAKAARDAAIEAATKGGPGAKPAAPGAAAPKLGPDGKPLPGSEAKPDGAKEPAKDGAAGPVARPAAPPSPPDPKELLVRPDADGTVQFHFRNQPWPELLRWLADVSNLSLDWQELPGDYLNLATQRPYTLLETRDTINRHLLTRGFTLLESEGVLTVAKIASINPALVPRVAPKT